MLYDRTWAIPHAISLLIACLYLLMAISRPLLARKFYAGLFSYATLVNASVAFYAPQTYVGNARYALLDVYRNFIEGWFSEHVGLVVGIISFAQLMITVGLVAGGWAARVALVGAIMFFVAIAPLGVASAFPSSLIWAAGAFVLLLAPRAQRSLRGSLPSLSLARATG